MIAQDLVAQLHARGAQLAVEDGTLRISAPDDALDDTLLVQLRQHKEAIIALVAKLEQAASGAIVPVCAAHPAAYECPASLAQQRMLFMEELAGGSSYYNIPLAFRISGPLDKAALARAFDALLAAHDVLRTVYRSGAAAIVQSVQASPGFELREFDLRAAIDRDAALAALLATEADYRFDLGSAIPLRAALIATGSGEHVLAVNVHHIAADGYSARKLLGDLGRAYSAAAPARSWQYADYVAWQDRWQQSAQYELSRTYWLDALADLPQLHGIMPDRARPGVQDVTGSHLRTPVPPALWEAVGRTARANGTTPFVVCQAVYAALLARYSGEQDVVFGTAAANRQPAEFSDTIGLFVNTLVLRYQVADGATFSELIAQAKQVGAGALRHQQFPFDALVEALQPARSAAYNPLVQLMLVMQDEDGQALVLDGAAVAPLAQHQQVSKFDIALHLRASGGTLTLDWEYSSALFGPDTMARMSGHFLQLLQACVDDSACVPAAVALAGSQAASAPMALGTAPLCVHRQFEQQAARRPQACALREGELAISYGTLNEQAELVAGHLAQAGVVLGTPVGVCMEKCTNLVVAMLAIYKAGGVYVPLDPHYPAQRLAFMVRDSGIALLLTGAGASPLASEALVPQLAIEALLATPAAAGYTACDDIAGGAYIIYTSGSTGQPKGVLVTHANLAWSLRANGALMQIGEQDLMPTIGSQAFGASLLEILLPLTAGGAVRLVSKAQVADMDLLIAATSDVTVMHAVPSLMRQWLDALEGGVHGAVYPQLRLLLVGGEAVPERLLRRIRQWRPSVRLLALYGMTESAIVCSSFEPGEHAPAHCCIGKPYAHARFYVLGRQGQEQPLGVPGELHIGGLSVAAGYVGQPGMTRERFPDSPFEPGQRMYRTGDRVRLLADGNFEFLGRVDHQVSLRGARIELGEIETLAGAIDGVSQAVAHVAELADEQQVLVLYYTSAAGAEAQAALAATMRASMALHLPEYMRPSMIELLAQFPLNPNGKVDRKKLPAPQAQTGEIVAPATDIEQRLLVLCQSLLQREPVSVTANFFEIGGHSLLAARLVTAIRADFGIAFPLTALYTSPTIRACGTVVEAALRDKYAASLVNTQEDAPSLGEDLIL